MGPLLDATVDELGIKVEVAVEGCDELVDVAVVVEIGRVVFVVVGVDGVEVGILVVVNVVVVVVIVVVVCVVVVVVGVVAVDDIVVVKGLVDVRGFKAVFISETKIHKL